MIKKAYPVDHVQEESIQMIHVEQSTPEWHAHREQYINASEIAGIMGLSKYDTPTSILEKKTNVHMQAENDAMRHGKNMEPVAREWVSDQLMMKFEPYVFTRGFLSASLDAWNVRNCTLVEMKCPVRLSPAWENFKRDQKVPVHYYPQVQAQIYCSGALKAYFLMFINDQEHRLVEVPKNEAFIRDMLQLCQEFYKKFMALKRGK